MSNKIMNFVYELYESYIYYFNERSDKRVDGWLLMNSYIPTLVITAVYLLILYVGPKIMENRKAFCLKWPMFIYNLALVYLNFHIFSEVLYCSYSLGYNYICQPCISSYDPRELRITKAIWWYYFSKCIEYMDTFFFILRKKNSQITFLHVYHHATMFPIWFIGTRWTPGGDAFFGVLINSFVHVLMYSYYALAGLGPAFQPYLWWKRYMTKIQLLQFCLGITHSAISIAVGCNFPIWMHWALITYGFSLMILFLNFYKKTYQFQKKAISANGDCKKLM